MTLEPGDEYTVEWASYDQQRYRVEEVRGNIIVFRRWLARKGGHPHHAPQPID